MNDKLSTLRREMYRELKDVQRRDVLKGVRWLLVKNPENLQQTSRGDERSRLAEALKLNEPLAQAYYLKETTCVSSGNNPRRPLPRRSSTTGADAPKPPAFECSGP